jgi:hypothetical protein
MHRPGNKYCTHTHTYTHTHTHTTDSDTHTHTNAQTHTHTHVHARTHTHTHTHIQARTHTQTHTHKYEYVVLLCSEVFLEIYASQGGEEECMLQVQDKGGSGRLYFDIEYYTDTKPSPIEARDKLSAIIGVLDDQLHSMFPSLPKEALEGVLDDASGWCSKHGKDMYKNVSEV